MQKLDEKKKSTIRIVLAAILLVGLVYVTFINADLKKVWNYIAGADYFWVFLSVPVMILSHWVRAIRWKTMLEPFVSNISTWNLFKAVMAGYAVNNILPRGGEFVRPYIISFKNKVSYSSTFATILVERFVDLLFLVIMFFGAFFMFKDHIKLALVSILQKQNQSPDLMIYSVLISGLLIVGVLLLSFYPPIFRKMLKYTIKPISAKVYNRILELFEKLVKGFMVLRKPSRYLSLTFESLLIWLLYTVPLYLMFFSFGFDKPPFGLDFGDALFLIVVSGIAFTIAPTPGAIAVFHPAIVISLAVIGNIQYNPALAFATVNHGVGYLVQVVIGGIFLITENVRKIPTSSDLSDDKLNNGELVENNN